MSPVILPEIDGHLTVRALEGDTADGFALCRADCFPVVEVDDAAARDVVYGRPLALTVPPDVCAVLHEGQLLALYRPEGTGAVPVAVLV